MEIVAVEEPDDVADDVCDAVAVAHCDAEDMPDAVGVSEPSRDQVAATDAVEEGDEVEVVEPVCDKHRK